MTTPKKKRSRAISATALMSQLQRDEEYQRKAQSAEASREARGQELRRAERPIVTDLHNSGVRVDSVWELVNSSELYPRALPVLMDHLERGGYPDRVMESLGRALAVNPAVASRARLKLLYINARNSGEEDGIAVALAACATKEQFDELVGLLCIEERGQSLIYFIRPILTVGGARGKAVVEGLQSDPVFGKEASALLHPESETES